MSGLLPTTIAPASSSICFGVSLWSIALSSHARSHSRHSLQTAQFKHRCASLTAISAVNPSLTSSKLPIRSSYLRHGIGWRSIGGINISSRFTSTGAALSRKHSFPSSSPRRNLSIKSAARRPAAIALIIGPGSPAASPAANIPGILVAIVRGSTTMCFFPSVRVRSPLRKDRSGLCPTATMAVSASTRNSDPSMGIGRRRPLLSGSPNLMRMHSTPVILPFWPIILTGATRYSISTPSSCASATSSGLAGISSRLRL
ncbi:hypothetical protein ES703_119418 [subsurface metagenome]